MLSWRDSLIPAKFRNVEFSIISHSYSGGRRNAIHEYPFQDEPFAEDMGKSADQFSIEGYIIQEKPFYNYFKKRDKLIKALKEGKKGQLDHPYLGEKQVVCNSFSLNETIQEGGVARFSMSFTEAGNKKNPKAATSKVVVDTSAWATINAAINEFTEAWDKAQGVVSDINSGMQQIQSSILLIRSLPAAVISRSTALTSQAVSLVSTVLDSPCALAQAITSGFEGVQYAAGLLKDEFDRGITERCSDTNAGASSSSTGTSSKVVTEETEARPADQPTKDEALGLCNASLAMNSFGSSTGDTDGNVSNITVTSENSALAYANQLYLTALFRANAVANATMIAVRGLYDSYDEAEQMLNLISNAIDDLVEYLGDLAGDPTIPNQGVTYSNDETYSKLKELKPVFVKAMLDLGATLAMSKDYRVKPDVENTLTLAYNQYEDLGRSNEIIRQNPLLIPHPGFLPGGKDIRILTA
jgi:prophage DNA circulation protein